MDPGQEDGENEPRDQGPQVAALEQSSRGVVRTGSDEQVSEGVLAQKVQGLKEEPSGVQPEAQEQGGEGRSQAGPRSPPVVQVDPVNRPAQEEGEDGDERDTHRLDEKGQQARGEVRLQSASVNPRRRKHPRITGESSTGPGGDGSAA